MGKPKTDRTERMVTASRRRVLAEQCQNVLERRRFDRLVRSGVIVEKGKSMLKSEAGGQGKAGAGDAISTTLSLKYFLQEMP